MFLFRKKIPLLAVMVLIAACSGSTTMTVATTASATTALATTTESSGAGGDYPVTVEPGNGPVTIDAAPQAIVSLSPTATEMLFAIGAGPQVVAVDTLSNYPPEAPVTDLAAFTPNTEAIASYRPDLVVVAFDANELLAGLAELEIPTLLLSAAGSIEDVYAQIELLGVATAHVGEAAELVGQITADLDGISSSAPRPTEPLTYYYELDPNAFYSVTSSTFIGSVLAALGVENIADPADADGSAFGYPQLSSEFIVAADPDLILLADTKCCDQNAATVAARPGWAALTAVTSGGVVELDDDIASRWGPRIVDLLEVVAERVAQLVPTQ
jgi:iron complex transport system substrate-binding protein